MIVRPIVLGPPLRGGDWHAANGPSNTSGHRRALVPIDGGAYIAQRFAIDWARIGANGRLFDGDPADNASYHGYGAEVIAVVAAEGVPYVIDAWELMRGPGTWERRTNELPIQNEVVRFPGN